jgi:hypothetical protein
VGEENVSVGKPEGMKVFQRLHGRWDSNITIGLKNVGWEIVDWIHLA